MRLDEAAQAEPVLRSENDTQPMVESDTVDVTGAKRSVDPNCVSKSFDPDAVCEEGVYDMLVLQHCVFRDLGQTTSLHFHACIS